MHLDVISYANGHSDHPGNALRAEVPELQSRPPVSLRNNTYQSCRGSRVVLEFADPTVSLVGGPSTAPFTPLAYSLDRHETSLPFPNVRLETSNGMQLESTQSRRGAVQLSPNSMPKTSGGNARNVGSRTRLQASFNALKRISSGLRSPWSENGPNRDEDAGPRGYFD